MAAQTYWITFHIKDVNTAKGDYSARYKALTQAIFEMSDGYWPEPTSFILFSTDKSAAEIIAAIKGAIQSSVDLVVLGMPSVKRFDVIGATAHLDVIQSLVDFAKKV